MNIIKINFEDIPKLTHTPILTYCRQLIKDGVDPDTRLDVYDGTYGKGIRVSVLNIGDGAKLTVKEDPYVHFARVSSTTAESFTLDKK